MPSWPREGPRRHRRKPAALPGSPRPPAAAGRPGRRRCPRRDLPGRSSPWQRRYHHRRKRALAYGPAQEQLHLPSRAPSRSLERSAPCRARRLAGRAGSRHGILSRRSRTTRRNTPLKPALPARWRKTIWPKSTMARNQSAASSLHTTRSRGARGPPTCVPVLGYVGCAFATRGRDERSATARDFGGHARPIEPASGSP